MKPLRRLSKFDPRYGIAGNVISHEFWMDIPWKDRSLYDKVNEDGDDYPYKIELKFMEKTPSLYFMENFNEVIVLLVHLFKRAGDTTMSKEGIEPETSFSKVIGDYKVNVIYRPEHET